MSANTIEDDSRPKKRNFKKRERGAVQTPLLTLRAAIFIRPACADGLNGLFLMGTVANAKTPDPQRGEMAENQRNQPLARWSKREMRSTGTPAYPLVSQLLANVLVLLKWVSSNYYLTDSRMNLARTVFYGRSRN